MVFDLHTHHERCGHAVGTIEEYIQAAIENGLSAIGISDHSPYFVAEEDHPSPGLAMARSQFPKYIREIVQLKSKYKSHIEVLVGVESDFFPESIQRYAEIYRLYPIDYLIGSIHIPNGKHISDRHLWVDLDDEQLDREKEVYFDLLQQAARSGVFQIIGHMDLMKRYYKTFMRTCGPLIEQTLKVFADTGVSIEVNTSGVPRDEGYSPCYEVLERASYYRVPVTFGSDSHKPERVGENWAAVVDMLKQLGYQEMQMYRNRQPIRIPF